MDQGDNDLQGSDGSGSLGGPDVRRRIPIKLISKPPLRSKPPPRATRPGGRVCKSETGEDDNFGFKQDERFDCPVKDVYGNQRRFPQPLFWDFKINLVGEKDKLPIHFCDKCGLPIHLYGRMIPCKHVFCYECALLHEKKGDKMCPGLTMYSCSDPVQRIEQCHRGSLWMCSVVPGCKRTYLSERDLQAHVNHRHLRAAKSSSSSSSNRGGPDPLHLPPPTSDHPDRYRVPPPHLQKNHHMPNLPPHGPHDPYSQPPPGAHDQPPPNSGMGPETFRIATVTTRKHSNLITVPIQDDSGSGRETCPLGRLSRPRTTIPATIPHNRLWCPTPPPPHAPAALWTTSASSTSHKPPNAAPTGHWHSSHGVQPGPSAMTNAPPPITPPPGHILGQMPPYMNHPPPPQHSGPPPPVNAPPPHHYNPNSMQQFPPEDQGTLSPPFTQPGASVRECGRLPGSASSSTSHAGTATGQMPGQHHPDQGRYRPYYQ
ncbi:hypothetical protein WMY93_022190 [Mugilogobius chulae]|uniref:E3 ubiquitin-protein ligase Hakai n=1 Tax=Mugilogobius chulae TaxID=88201 RepID=A0AAW0NEA0_9GOBI